MASLLPGRSFCAGDENHTPAQKPAQTTGPNHDNFRGRLAQFQSAPANGLLQWAQMLSIMEKRTFCVYNQTRECFLCLGVTPADTIFLRLKGLIGKLKLKLDEGLWVVPSQGVHTFGVLFPLDLIYLDSEYKVIHVIEHFPRFRIAPLKTQAASVLELPTHTIYSSQTQPGDQLIICAVEEIESRFQQGSIAQIEGQAR